jgi:hypothetical protein
VIDVEPGAIRLRRAGAVSQHIRAADVRAASAARLPTGFSLALVRYEPGDPPLWLELQTADDVERVRRALGVGHSGFGELSWPPRRTFHGKRTPVDVLAAALWLATIAAVYANSEADVTLGVLFVVLAVVATALGAATRRSRHGVSLSPAGLTIADGARTRTPWADVVAADAQGEALLVRTSAGAQLVPTPDALPLEREHLVAQIRSAALRAHGEGPLPPGVPSSLAVLAPRDEGSRAWIERVDATAATLLDRDGYRRTGVVERDLWETLESTDAPPRLRAAAARILARVAPEEAGPRIAQVLVQEHDAGAGDCIRVALEEDVELAAQAFDRLDRDGS